VDSFPPRPTLALALAGAKMLALAVGSEIPIDAGELVAYPGLIPFEG
jgi:hypothetical protein